MVIAFKARVNDPTVASFRYRVLAPIEALQASGHAAELFDPARQDHYTTVVFSKAFKPADQALARALAAQGKRTILDLCDNMLFNPLGLPKYEAVREDLLAMIAACQGVTCSTPVLASQIQREAGLDNTPAVAPDPYQPSSARVRVPRRMPKPARLLWFGRHGAPNAEAGMADLLLIRDALAEAASVRAFELVVCSDSREKFDALFGHFPVPTRYVEWSEAACEAELGACDAVVLPLSDNPFVAAKSHNRLTYALSAGVPVIADAIDSYREFAPFCYLDDWTNGLRAVLAQPLEARTRAAGAREYLEKHWSKAAIAPLWARALAPASGTDAAVHHQSLDAMMIRQPFARPGDALGWIAAAGDERPWLVVGAEADAGAVLKARAEGYAVLSVGDGPPHAHCDAALITDIETLREHGEAFERHDCMVIAPEVPLNKGWPPPRPLTAWYDRVPALVRLSDHARLLSWPVDPNRLALTEAPAGDEPALRLLTDAGVRLARHLGVRRAEPSTGGVEALGSFASRRTGGLARLRRETGVSYGPYGYPVPARIFVGSDDEQLLGARVLAYSLEKHSTMDVQVEVLDFRHIPVPKDPKNRSRTGFSFCRFDIPRLCGYEGRGVYVDADMQVFTDVTDLWTMSFEEADVLYALSHPSQGRTPQTSVMLLNCDALKWDIDTIIAGLDEQRYGYKDLMQKMCIHPPDRVKPLLPYWWNSLERYEPGRTCLIHYTDMPTQPWVSHGNPNGQLWYDALAEALDEGFISEDEVADAVAKGHVSPRIYQWLGRADPSPDVPVWVAPYHRFTKAGSAIEGEVALTSEGRLRGWAYDPAAPGQPVRLGAYVADRRVMAFDAGDYAEILERHGKGDGRHAFDVATPPDLWKEGVESLSVRPLEQGADLSGSPLPLTR